MLKVINPQVSGSYVTYDVATDNFNAMIGMQYAITYPADELSVVSIKSINLPQMNQGSFNTDLTGEIRNVWLVSDLIGITLDDNTVIYQIEFEMLNGTHGQVCFSEDPLVIEMINETSELEEFTIVDDCHTEPHDVNLVVSSMRDLAKGLGLHVQSTINNGEIRFHLDAEETMPIEIFSTSGELIKRIDRRVYSSGDHVLKLSTVSPGMYLFSTNISNQQITIKLLAQ